MARPIKEGMDYFPHDTDASNDEKLEILTALYGNDGYAFYFIILERIYRQKNFELDISKIETKKVLSKKIRVTLTRFQKILESSINATLFNPELAKQEILTSDGIKKRANALISKRLDMQERRNNKGVNSPQTQQQTQQETHQQTTPQSAQSKVKESKEKKRKESSIEDKKNDLADSSIADDDFFYGVGSDFDEVHTVPHTDNLDDDFYFFADLLDSGLTRQQAIEITSKYPEPFIKLKLGQIKHQAKSGTIKNLPAYILKAFENADFECDQEMKKIKAKASEEQKKQAEMEELNRLAQEKEKTQDKYQEFINHTDRLMRFVTESDKDEFVDKVVNSNNIYPKLYAKDGLKNIVIDGKFREFIFERYGTLEENTS